MTKKKIVFLKIINVLKNIKPAKYIKKRMLKQLIKKLANLLYYLIMENAFIKKRGQAIL